MECSMFSRLYVALSFSLLQTSCSWLPGGSHPENHTLPNPKRTWPYCRYSLCPMPGINPRSNLFWRDRGVEFVSGFAAEFESGVEVFSDLPALLHAIAATSTMHKRISFDIFQFYSSKNNCADAGKQVIFTQQQVNP